MWFWRWNSGNPATANPAVIATIINHYRGGIIREAHHFDAAAEFLRVITSVGKHDQAPPVDTLDILRIARLQRIALQHGINIKIDFHIGAGIEYCSVRTAGSIAGIQSLYDHVQVGCPE